MLAMQTRRGLGAPVGYSSNPVQPSGFGPSACGMLYPQLLPNLQYDMDPAHTIANTIWVQWCYANPNATTAQKLAYAQQLYNTSDASIMAQSAATQAAISAPGGPPGSAQFPTLVVTTNPVTKVTTTSYTAPPTPLLGANTNPATGKPFNAPTNVTSGTTAGGQPVNTKAPTPAPAPGTTPTMSTTGTDGTSVPIDFGDVPIDFTAIMHSPMTWVLLGGAGLGLYLMTRGKR